MKTLVAALILSASLSIASLCFAADKGTVVKHSDLPALKGGKVPTSESVFPLCVTGRMVSDWGTVMDLDDRWTAEKVSKHGCSGASVVYVCRAGRNLSVRCE